MREKEKAAVATRFHPSPTMQVRFSNGEVVAMNRKERRKLGIKVIRQVKK